jgi:hypothetical protein
MTSEWKRFWDEVKASAKRLGEFAAKHKGVIAVLILAIIFLYGQKIFYYDISIDSEVAINDPAEIFNQWLAIDRFGLVVTKKIFNLTLLVPAAADFLMAITLGFTAFFLDFCVHEWKGKDEGYSLFYYIFPAAYVSAPCLAEQFNFTLQSFEIAWAGLLCILAVYCFSRIIFYKESFFWAVPGFIMTVWSFGSYQAFAGLFIASAVISYMLAYQNGRTVLKGTPVCLLAVIKYIIAFAAGFAGYIAASKAVQALFHIVPSAYVENMSLWSTGNTSAALSNISADAGRIYLGSMPLFFQSLFLPVMIVSLLLLLYRGLKARRSGFAIYIIAAAVLAVSPLLLSIAGGNIQPIRGQIVYPLVYAFYLGYITTFSIRAVSGICCFIAAMASFYQGTNMTQLFYVSHMVYEHDKLLASDIYEEIDEAGRKAGLDEYTVVFIGSKSNGVTEGYPKGEVIGHSFFEWDSDWYYGSTRRIAGLCDTLGYQRLVLPSEEQTEAAKAEAETMPSWPEEGSVKESDGVIIIKLSDG